jgi:flagellar hook-basal body complex protein FliE
MTISPLEFPDLSALGAAGSTGATGAGALTGVTPTTPTDAASATGGPADAGGTDFGSLVADGLDRLEGLQNTSSNLAVQAATGDLGAIHDYTIAATEASTATQLTVALRNQAIGAFNQIMQMQV